METNSCHLLLLFVIRVNRCLTNSYDVVITLSTLMTAAMDLIHDGLSRQIVNVYRMYTLRRMKW